MFRVSKQDFLISLYIFCVMVSELMGAKTFPLMQIGSLKLNASVAIFVVPLAYMIIDMITEVQGKERARSLVRSGILMIVFLILFSLLATKLPPSHRFVPSEAAYESIFTKSIRISLASLTAFGLGEFLEVLIFSKLREHFGQGKLWFRNNVANFVSEFLDTVVFMTLAFSSLALSFSSNFHFLFSLILPYWLIKCAMSILETPFLYLGVRWLRKAETA